MVFHIKQKPDTKAYAVCFHVYEDKEQAKLSNSDRNQVGWRGRLAEWETWGKSDRNVPCFNWGDSHTVIHI